MSNVSCEQIRVAFYFIVPFLDCHVAFAPRNDNINVTARPLGRGSPFLILNFLFIIHCLDCHVAFAPRNDNINVTTRPLGRGSPFLIHNS